MSRRIRAFTPERLGDLWEPCVCCTFWQSARALEPECGAVCDADGLRAWVSDVAAGWGDCGRILYVDGTAYGFVRYAPAHYLPQTRHMAAGMPSPDAVVLACLHVAADVRDVGLGKVLLQAALRDLAGRGERAIEAYGAAEQIDRLKSPMATVDFLLRQGFTVARPHPRYPLLRLELKTLAAWTENLEAVLETLQLPLLRREGVPSPLARPG